MPYYRYITDTYAVKKYCSSTYILECHTFSDIIKKMSEGNTQLTDQMPLIQPQKKKAIITQLQNFVKVIF